MNKIYAYAIEQKRQGKTNEQIRQDLVSKGIDEEGAKIIVNNIDKAEQQQQKAEGGSFPKWLIYILILILINVLSAVFGWGFWIY